MTVAEFILREDDRPHGLAGMPAAGDSPWLARIRKPSTLRLGYLETVAVVAA